MSIRFALPLAIATLAVSGCADTTPTAPATPEAARLEAGAPALASSAGTTRGAYAVQFGYPVCGEWVDFTGELRWQFHLTTPPARAQTDVVLFSKSWFHGVRGVGLTSGAEYRMNGQGTSSYGPGIYGGNGTRFTSVVKQQFIQQGQGKVFEITATYHLVTTPNGLAVEREEYSATCL